MKGYKGFKVENGRMYCRDFIYKVGEAYEILEYPILCRRGFHFCQSLNNVHSFYNLSNSVICEVEALGDVVNETDMSKSCTNKIKIIRLLTKEEVLKISNTGDRNSGYGNSGYGNSGDRNSGDWNSGDWNSGNWNSGNWNSGNFNNGFFNSKINKCFIFDKISIFTTEEFIKSKYYKALNSVKLIITEWINYEDTEKENDKAKKLIGGYLKTYNYKEACATWWDKLTEENKQIIQEMPNFNKEVFKKITGIELEAINED